MALSDRDLQDIQLLLAHFVYCLDAGDPDGWTNSFAPDGTFVNRTHRIAGRDAIRPFITQLMTSGDAGPTATPRLIHLHTPAFIEGDGDHASALSYWQVATQAKDGSIIIWRVGEFRDKLIKHDGQWLFEERYIPTLLGTVPLSDI